MLFSAHERTDGRPKRYRETEFAFIDRSADPDIAAVRALLEAEFNAYPGEGKKDIIGRLTARDARDFSSACFELLLYGMLVRQGCRVEIHPDPQNGSDKRPDFLVFPPDASPFFLEAVLATQVRDFDNGAAARMEHVLDALDATPHPHFFVSVVTSGQPQTMPSAKDLKARVHRWLDALDPAAGGGGLGAYPRLAWTHAGWTLEFQAMRRGREGDDEVRLIGALTRGLGFVDLRAPIREAIRFKGGRYGELPHPLVVAVNLDAFFLDAFNETGALFGTDALAVAMDGQTRVGRDADGAWGTAEAPRSARVAAAWLFNDLEFHSLAGRRQTLYLNPWASRPLDNPPPWLPLARVVDRQIVRRPGLSPGQIYGLA